MASLKPITGTDSISPRETKVNDKLEITLEPYEEGSVPLNMKGGIVREHDISFVYNNTTDPATKAVYDAATDTVKITLGRDEKGCGMVGADKYTFTIDVYLKGTR